MGTMRDNFTAAFVLLAVMLSTSQSLLHGEENASGRNSLTPTTSHSTTYNCLFVDENMPICDPKQMLDSNEDSWISTSTDDETTGLNENLDKGGVISSESPVFTTIKRITVYTFAGCVPPIPREGLRSLMPFCEGIPLNKIVSVQRFRSFAVKGVEEPPLEFPKVNYGQWRTMMMRLGKHPKKNRPVVSNESSQPPQVPPKKTMPNASATDKNTSKGSSSSSFVILDSSKPLDPKNTGNILDASAPATPALGKASRTSIGKDRRFYKKSVVDVPFNDLTNADDSSGTFVRAESILSSDAITRRLRRKRDLIY